MTRGAGRGDRVVALLQALSDDQLRQWDGDRGWQRWWLSTRQVKPRRSGLALWAGDGALHSGRE